jgi:ergothioneine biosynthesis protein EgtC
MCRFVVYLGPPITLDMLIARPEYSIIHQSYKSRFREEPLNGDGFGIAWYQPRLSEEPAMFRSIRPAWNNQNLLDLSRVTQSGAIFAHIRAATTGIGVSESNCHPFKSGPLAFMHNGAVAGFAALKRKMQQRLSDQAFASIRGTTDSEHVFAIFQDRYAEREAMDPTERLSESLRAAIEEVAEMVKKTGTTKATALNIAVTDGQSAAVSRFTTGTGDGPTLFVLTGSKLENVDGEVRMESPGASHEAVLVASEPLTDERGWTVVPPQHLLSISPDHRIDYIPLGDEESRTATEPFPDACLGT